MRHSMINKKSNFLINLLELQYRVFYAFISFTYCFIINIIYKIELFYSISKLFLKLQNYFIYTSILEPIIIYIKLSILSSIIFSFPLFIYIFIFFIFKSVYKLYLYIYMYIFLFVIFVNYIYYKLFLFKAYNYILAFLIGFQRSETNVVFKLNFEAKMDQYYFFYFNIIYFYIFIIVIPLIIFIIITSYKIIYFWNIKVSYKKFLYLFILFLFLLIAPPDLYLQIIILPYVILIIETYVYIFIFFINIYKNYLFV